MILMITVLYFSLESKHSLELAKEKKVGSYSSQYELARCSQPNSDLKSLFAFDVYNMGALPSVFKAGCWLCFHLGCTS